MPCPRSIVWYHSSASTARRRSSGLRSIAAFACEQNRHDAERQREAAADRNARAERVAARPERELDPMAAAVDDDTEEIAVHGDEVRRLAIRRGAPAWMMALADREQLA